MNCMEFVEFVKDQKVAMCGCEKWVNDFIFVFSNIVPG